MDTTRNDPPPASPPGAGAANPAAAEQQTRDLTGATEPLVPHAASLAEAAVLLGEGPRPGELLDGGPGVGAAQVAERTEGFVLRPTGTHLADRLREAEAVRRPLVGRDVLPRADFAIDPDTVPGVRLATAAGQVRRNGMTYQAGATLSVDYRAYVELVRVGHILNTGWEHLPDHQF